MFAMKVFFSRKDMELYVYLLRNPREAEELIRGVRAGKGLTEKEEEIYDFQGDSIGKRFRLAVDRGRKEELYVHIPPNALWGDLKIIPFVVSYRVMSEYVRANQGRRKLKDGNGIYSLTLIEADRMPDRII